MSRNNTYEPNRLIGAAIGGLLGYCFAPNIDNFVEKTKNCLNFGGNHSENKTRTGNNKNVK